MKRISFITLISTAILIAIAGCKKEESEYHEVYIYNPFNCIGAVYADQTADTVKFSSTENYEFTSSADWITIDAERSKGTVKQGFILNASFPVTFTTNNTGKVREGLIKGRVWSEGFDRNIAIAYRQAGWLNIVCPYPKYPTADTAEFTATDSAHWDKNYLIFETHGDWTLSIASGEYVALSKTSGKAGRDTVELTLTPNLTAEKNTATINLTSNGITTQIVRTQLPKKQ